jgi:hypothetical protein
MAGTPRATPGRAARLSAARLSVVDLVSGRMVRQVKVGRSPHGVWTLDHAPR